MCTLPVAGNIRGCARMAHLLKCCTFCNFQRVAKVFIERFFYRFDTGGGFLYVIVRLTFRSWAGFVCQFLKGGFGRYSGF